MRWGVREDASDDHSTTKLCLDEIRNCQEISCGPNFIVSKLHIAQNMFCRHKQIDGTSTTCIMEII
jgi:hypothetical protein